jgi:hypothetical protein
MWFIGEERRPESDPAPPATRWADGACGPTSAALLVNDVPHRLLVAPRISVRKCSQRNATNLRLTTLGEAIENLQPPSDRGGKVATLLLCSGCGEDGCWPLKTRIEASREGITWSAFRQPHRHDWDLSSLGPFLFDRLQYAREIELLSRSV